MFKWWLLKSWIGSWLCFSRSMDQVDHNVFFCWVRSSKQFLTFLPTKFTNKVTQSNDLQVALSIHHFLQILYFSVKVCLRSVDWKSLFSSNVSKESEEKEKFPFNANKNELSTKRKKQKFYGVCQTSSLLDMSWRKLFHFKFIVNFNALAKFIWRHLACSTVER